MRYFCTILFFFNQFQCPLTLYVKKEKIEDTKGIDRQWNGQKKTTNHDLQNITQKTKDRAT
jgi:hypothetical protein